MNHSLDIGRESKNTLFLVIQSVLFDLRANFLAWDLAVVPSNTHYNLAMLYASNVGFGKRRATANTASDGAKGFYVQVQKIGRRLNKLFQTSGILMERWSNHHVTRYGIFFYEFVFVLANSLHFL